MIDPIFAPLDGVGVSAYEVRNLATEALSALGVNLRADDGVPTLETIYTHALTELGAEMALFAEFLEKDNDEIACQVRRLHGRLDLICQQAPVLARIHASHPAGSR